MLSFSACAALSAAGSTGDLEGKGSFMARAGFLFLMLLTALLLAPGPSSPLLAQSASMSRPANPNLTPKQSRGENLFLQRCSVCHLRRQLKFGSPPTTGPSLQGLFRSDDPEEQQRLLEQIRNGSPNMPGFRYGLDPRQIDDLISYLKVF